MASSADDCKPNDKRSYNTYLLIDFLLSPLPAFCRQGTFLIVMGGYGLFYPKNSSMAQEQNYQVNYTINVEATEGTRKVQAFADSIKSLVLAKNDLTPAVTIK